MARSILSALNYIPTVLILSQDAFYNEHTPEELELAFRNELDVGECLVSLVVAGVLLIPRPPRLHRYRLVCQSANPSRPTTSQLTISVWQI